MLRRTTPTNGTNTVVFIRLNETLTPHTQALTVVSLKGISTSFELELVLADRFTIDYSEYPFVDTEDFLVVGTKGDLKASGRLNGLAKIYSFPNTPLKDQTLSVSGMLCVK